MKIAKKEAAATPTALDKLQEIQQGLLEVTKPHYHEYYKATKEHGFIKITIPKNK